ncbi:unnamed protein product, partial [Prorocentrum cordatum]
ASPLDFAAMSSATFGCRPAPDDLLDPSAARAADPAAGKQSVYLGLDTTLPDVDAERREEIRKKYPHFPDIYDQSALRREYVVRLPRWVEDWANANLIRDPRDTIMLSALANMFMCTGSLSVVLFLVPSHMLGLLVVLLNSGMWLQRFILMMHYSDGSIVQVGHRFRLSPVFDAVDRGAFLRHSAARNRMVRWRWPCKKARVFVEFYVSSSEKSC